MRRVHASLPMHTQFKAYIRQRNNDLEKAFK